MRIVAEVLRRRHRIETRVSDQAGDLLGAIGRKPVLRPQLAIVREGGAHEPGQRRAQETAAPGETEKLRGVGEGADIGRDDIGDDQRAAGLELAAPDRQQRDQFVAARDTGSANWRRRGRGSRPSWPRPLPARRPRRWRADRSSPSAARGQWERPRTGRAGRRPPRRCRRSAPRRSHDRARPRRAPGYGRSGRARSGGNAAPCAGARRRSHARRSRIRARTSSPTHRRSLCRRWRRTKPEAAWRATASRLRPPRR